MSRTSWITPFALGAAASLSLAWVSGRLTLSKGSSSSNGTISKSPERTTQPSASRAPLGAHTDPRRPVSQSSLPPTPRTSNVKPSTSFQEEQEEDEGEVVLMDSMELDQRLLRKAEAVIQWRTSRLVLVVERCTNDHNYSAILRTTEALGIQTVYMIDPPAVIDDPLAMQEDHMNQQEKRKLRLSTPEEIEARREHHLFAKKATEWLTVKDFATAEECVEELRSLGYELWVTDLSQQAECLTATSPQIPEKVALVMGTEAVGCSQYMLDEADKRVYLPLRGYADSLNLSVATALILHQLFIMDPTLVGAMSEAEKLDLRKAWYGKLCQQRLLTPSQRKARVKLLGFIKKCHAIHEKSRTRPLQPSEQKKLNELSTYERQLEELESALDPEKVQAAIQEWVAHPPTPLTDVRRADEHRVCYVGKNTRSSNKDHWRDMAATANVPSLHMSSAKEFREKVRAVDEQGV